MIRGMYDVVSGAINHQMRLQVLANNLSNINTVGFKEDRASFGSSLYARSDDIRGKSGESVVAGNPEPSVPYIPFNSDLTFQGTRTDFSPGLLKKTGNPLDFAISGNGFFCVKTPDGIHYTRKGSFSLNQDGLLVTQEGFPVMGDGGEIQIDSLEFVVDNKGNVWTGEQQAGSMKIVDFPQPYAMKKTGNTLFALVGQETKEVKAEEFKINQGVVEMSNVNSIRVMTEMIEVQRAFESYQKVIQTIDSITMKKANEVGRLA